MQLRGLKPLQFTFGKAGSSLSVAVFFEPVNDRNGRPCYAGMISILDSNTGKCSGYALPKTYPGTVDMARRAKDIATANAPEIF